MTLTIRQSSARQSNSRQSRLKTNDTWLLGISCAFFSSGSSMSHWHPIPIDFQFAPGPLYLFSLLDALQLPQPQVSHPLPWPGFCLCKQGIHNRQPTTEQRTAAEQAISQFSHLVLSWVHFTAQALNSLSDPDLPLHGVDTRPAPLSEEPAHVSLLTGGGAVY